VYNVPRHGAAKRLRRQLCHEFPMSSPQPAPTLAELRREIDRIDEAMHRLLMERGDIIDRLIATKRTQETGSAFRPAREADMMRRLVERHRGLLPLDTVESIWRVIISTFTYVQAPFSVHADLTPGEAAIRDTARFHFGFTAPLVSHDDAAAVVQALRATRGDIGLVPAGTATTPWWSLLEQAGAPRIIARLPFVERHDHPAALPVFVLTHPAEDAVVTDVEVWSLRVSGWGRRPAEAIARIAEVLAVPEGAFDGAALLVSTSGQPGIQGITAPLVNAGASVRSAALVGSHAKRYTVAREGARPVPAGR
jgi:chorismate mutase